VAAHSYAENISVDGSKKVSVVGASGTILHPTGGDAIVISGGGALTLRGFVVTAPGNGASCSGSTSKLVATQTQFVSAGQNGVYTSTCPLTLDACFIDSNGAAGVVVSTDFTIRNSIITRNKTQGGVQQIGPPNTAVFFNNTVADNSGPTGVSCGAGAFVVNNSILYNNRNAGGLSETTCATQNSAGDIDGFKVDLRSQAPGFKQTGSGADYYHLVPASPCRNQAAREGAPTHDYDLEPRPDPTSNLVDIGADEIQ